MKTINLNKKSWHYWLATNVGSFDTDSGDFCAYVRSVLGNGFLVLFLSAIAAAISVFLLAGVTNIVVFLFDYFTGGHYTLGNNPFFFAGSVTLLLISVCGGFSFGLMKFRNWRNERRENQPPKPDSFAKSAYASFKEKVCFKVEFNGDGK